MRKSEHGIPKQNFGTKLKAVLKNHYEWLDQEYPELIVGFIFLTPIILAPLLAYWSCCLGLALADAPKEESQPPQVQSFELEVPADCEEIQITISSK